MSYLKLASFRSNRGLFIKGNVRWNKGLDSRGVTFTCKHCGKPKPLEEMKVAERFYDPLSLQRPLEINKVKGIN